MKTYLIKRSGNGECFLKVGVTQFRDSKDRHNFEKTKLVDAELPISDKIRRMLNGEKYLPDDAYPDVEELAVAEFQHESQAIFLEHALITEFKPIQYIPKLQFSGRNECFVYSAVP